MQPFTLVPGRRYAAEFIGDEFGQTLRSYSPIRVDRVEPLGTGGGDLAVDFFHANYPQGVQGKAYRVRVLERQTRFLLARSLAVGAKRLLLIYEPTWAWLEEHCGLTAKASDIQAFLAEQAF